jgi:hypothetical protein
MGLSDLARANFVVPAVALIVGFVVLAWWCYDQPNWSKFIIGGLLVVGGLYGLIDAIEEGTRK